MTLPVARAEVNVASRKRQQMYTVGAFTNLLLALGGSVVRVVLIAEVDILVDDSVHANRR